MVQCSKEGSLAVNNWLQERDAVRMEKALQLSVSETKAIEATIKRRCFLLIAAYYTASKLLNSYDTCYLVSCTVNVIGQQEQAGPNSQSTLLELVALKVEGVVILFS